MQTKEYRRKYYLANKPHILKRSKEYRDNHREFYRSYHHEYYLSHKEESRAGAKRYYERNKDKVLSRNKVYWEENKTHLNALQRDWHKKNKVKVNQGKRLYWAKCLETLYSYLGNICCCKAIDCWHIGLCGISDRHILQFEHIQDNGKSDRKRFKGGQRAMIMYYVKHLDEVKQNLQLMCANCNWKKRARNREYRTS